MFFRKKPNTPNRQEALALKPVRLVEADLKEADDGGAKLTVKLEPRGASRWLFRVPAGTQKTFELDALGLFVWTHCDGKTSVQQLIRKLAKRYNLNLREAEVPTVQFLHTLTKKGLIGMPLKEKAEKGE